jgi:pumilio RNA-binding family
LAVHQNGNFVLQHILEFGNPAQRSKIQNFACEFAVKLAMHKFGSHLVEKCLACATPAQVAAMIDRFMQPVPADIMAEFKFEDQDVSMALPLLMSDAYANFVVQKAYDMSRGETRLKLSREIRSRTVALSKFNYGRHILAHINRDQVG